MEALYRKYRPSTFSDVIGQEHIERTLKNALEQNKVSHAYLFCGTRGTGKTTMARILAKALLCEQGSIAEPDGTCDACVAIAQGAHPDVYELDAASRTGVDNVREEIISRVNYAPTRGAWKIYIIDEAHMLSSAAFNALLKTLEEPPAHVVFILCTTDPKNVPETVQSRCQRFDFHRISSEAMVSRLGAICVSEQVEFEGEALDLIARRAEGGMRNALTSLEQLIAFGGGRVTLEGAQNLLGSLDEHDLSEIISAIGRYDAAACFNWVARYMETGADLAQFVRDLSYYVRNMYLLSMAGVEVEIAVSEATRKEMVDHLRYFDSDRLARLLLVLGDLSKDLRTSTNPRLSFEIALARMVRPESDVTIEALTERVGRLERKLDAVLPSLDGGALDSSRLVMSTTAPSASAATALPSPQTPPLSATSQKAASSQVPAASALPPSPPTPASVPDTSGVPVPSTDASAPTGPASVSSATVPESSLAHEHQSQQPNRPVASYARVDTSSSVRASSSLDLSNPAAVQRFWRSVTTSLRKANPARGVLFMNARVSVDANAQGLVIEFGADNGFAYTAAQKPEVQQLLVQTLESIAGAPVSYQIVLANNQGTASSLVPQTSASVSSATVSNTTPSGVTPSVVAPASAEGGSPLHQVAAADSYSASRVSYQYDSAPSEQASVVAAPSDTPVAQSSPEDFPSSAYAVDVPHDMHEEVHAAPTPDVSSGAPAFAPIVDASSSTSSSASVSATSATPTLQDHVTAIKEVNPETGDETAQIKEILSDSFGDGIKFEELSD